MSQIVTLELPDELALRAREIAAQTQHRLEDVLVEWLDWTIAEPPVEIERRVRETAQNRCGYCLSPQHLVMARLEIEHIIPLSKGGSDDESNESHATPPNRPR